LNKKKEILSKYLPEGSVDEMLELFEENPCHLKIVSARSTKHGDYRRFVDGKVQITINNDLNPYRFLITSLHELAHLKTYKSHGKVKPHGEEWRNSFQKLMLPFLRPEIFPAELLSVLARHMIKPRASSDSDLSLSTALKKYDPVTGKSLVGEIPDQSVFSYKNKLYVKEGKRRTRYACTELQTHKKYVFHPNAEVELIKTK
jgi:hypothetical protein